MKTLATLTAGLLVVASTALAAPNSAEIYYRTEKVDGLSIFYREAGAPGAPTIVLLHGFPTSSHMFRNLIPALADKFHVIAPDYPGFGQSSKPAIKDFSYTFDNLARTIDKFLEQKKISKYSFYVMDYGAPIGFRIAVKHPERVKALIIQNGNAYADGLKEFWQPLKAYWVDRSKKHADALMGSFTAESLRWQYTHGTRNPERVSPDNWSVDLTHLREPGNTDIQLALFYDYRSNPTKYAAWQEYFRKHQPPALIVWGKNDQIFPTDGAHPYKRDLKVIDFNILDTGHFALEEEGAFIAEKIRDFIGKHGR